MNGLTLEHIMQMGPMLVLAGLTAGWVAETISRTDAYGFIHDMVLGLIGSVFAGVMIWFTISSEAGMLAMFLIGCGGATLAIIAQRRFWRGFRGQNMKFGEDTHARLQPLHGPPSLC